MKYIIIFIFLCNNDVLFGQITLSELFTSYNSNPDQFETFIVNKGFQFDGFTNSKGKMENRCGFEFKKKNGSDSSVIRIYTYCDDKNKIYTISYSFLSASNYAEFKNEMSKFQFELISSKSDTDEYFNIESLNKRYDNKEWEINLYTTHSKEFGIQYQIVLEKPWYKKL